jgi:protein-S-isoprenylcysteine O-methyltransferase
MLHAITLIVLWLFPISEVGLALRKRATRSGATAQDHGSVQALWITFGLAIAGAVLLAYRHWLPLGLGQTVDEALVVGFMASGMILRWSAIRTLGRFFTVDVAIHPDQTVVQSGPYAWVRHPSYSGLLLLLLGLGFQFRDGLSMAVLLVPSAWVIWNRIRVEERALAAALGAPYAAYCLRTRRLVPGLL